MNEDIWADLDAIYGLPERQPGDIDSSQISARYKISLSAAQRRMKKEADSGEYEYITIRDSSSGNGIRKVIRKIIPKPEL
jgi:hypothetical protein